MRDLALPVYAAKNGFGTSTTLASKVWFTPAIGVLTEVFYPRVDTPIVKTLQLTVSTSAGLETELFQPGSETPKDFYAEQPIKLKMIGTYHQFGTFISDVASLPRVVILTMHDVSLTPLHAPAKGAEPAANEQLVLQGTVKTYRYLDDSETSEADKKSAHGKARRRK